MAKGRIEKAAEDAVPSGVDVSGVSIALEDAEGSVEGVTISNPKGFDDKPAMELGNVRFELDRGSLDGKNPLIIRRARMVYDCRGRI